MKELEHNFTHLVSMDENIEINEYIELLRGFNNENKITKAEMQYMYMEFLNDFYKQYTFEIYTNTNFMKVGQ